MFLGVAALHVLKEAQKSKPQYVILSVALLILAAIGFAVFKKRMWSLADDIVDCGDYLLVRFGEKEQPIYFSNITKVDVESHFGATTVRLRLSVPSQFGTVVSFLARQTSRNPFKPNAVAEELISRVNGKR